MSTPEAGPAAGSARRSLVREHAGYAIGVVILLVLLLWLTAFAGYGSALLAVLVIVAAFLYRLASHRRLSRAWRENLQFVILSVALLLLLMTLTRFNARAFLPVFTSFIIVYALFALGLNLQFGHAGIINFGHVAFMAIGAYTTVILSVTWVPHAPALLAPGPSTIALAAAAFLAAILLGGLLSVAAEHLPAVRQRPAQGARRIVLAAGILGAVFGLLLVLIVIPHPLTPFWARALLVAASAVIGMAAAALGGVLLGLPTLRLRADYLAIVTIGAAEILRRALRNEGALTGGHQGIQGFPRLFEGAAAEWAWLPPLADALQVGAPVLVRFGLALAALLLVVAAIAILLHSPYGRVLRAIREDEEVPRAVGKNVFRFKLQVFAIGGAVAALAGSIRAWDAGFIHPESFIPLFTFYAWIIIVVGGIGSIRGTILGSILLWTFFYGTQFLDLAARLGISASQESALRMVVIGVLLIVLMLFKPEGLLGRKEEMVLGR